MSSTKKERIKKRHASRNRRALKKMVRNIANIAHTLRYPQIVAKVGDFYLPTQNGRNIIFKHGQETQFEMITRLPNKKEKYDEVMYVLRFMYYFGDFSMKRNAYYTLKGMARKNPENTCVINFIKKHDMNSYTRLIKAFNTEAPYAEAIFRLNLGNCSTTCTTMYINKEEKVVEYDEDCIMINGGGDGNENKETENSGKEK